MDFRQIDKTLQQEFALKRINAEQIAYKNQKMAMQNPAYATLSQIEKELLFDVAKLKADGKEYKSLESSLTSARKKKNAVLLKLGLKPKDLVPNYECKICGDAGFVNGTMCKCFEKRRNAELAKAFGIELPKNCSLKGYKTDVCENKSQKTALEKLAKYLLNWAEKYPNITKTKIVISGKTGVGKTHLAQCLANELLQNGHSVCFVSAFALGDAFLNYHKDFSANKNSWLAPLIYSDFLFVDDLGTEPILKNVTLEYLFLILSERENLSKPVVITTNLSPEKLMAQYGERICSRLFNKNTSRVYGLDGVDLRK